MGLTIAAIMIASLAACGGSSDSGKGVEDSIDDDKIVINFFIAGQMILKFYVQ